MKKALLVAVLTLFSVLLHASDEITWNEEQRQVIEAMNRLSETTAVDGTGADGYALLLANDFSRWTVGSKLVNDKKSWVEGIREWFDDGWRVQDRRSQIIDVVVENDLAFTRRMVDEKYMGPQEQESFSSAALAEVWVRSNSQWLLRMVNVHPSDRN